MANDTVNHADSTAPHGAKQYHPRYAFDPKDIGLPEIDDQLIPGYVFQRFIDRVEDIAGGAEVILRMVEQDEINKGLIRDSSEPDKEPQPILNPFHACALIAMAASSLHLLSDESERLRQWALSRASLVS